MLSPNINLSLMAVHCVFSHGNKLWTDDLVESSTF